MSLETRPGIRTTELWLVVLANVLVNVGAIDVGDAKIRGILLVVSTVGYALSRGLAKAGVANDDPALELAGRSEGIKAQGFEPPV